MDHVSSFEEEPPQNKPLKQQASEHLPPLLSEEVIRSMTADQQRAFVNRLLGTLTTAQQDDVLRIVTNKSNLLHGLRVAVSYERGNRLNQPTAERSLGDAAITAVHDVPETTVTAPHSVSEEPSSAQAFLAKVGVLSSGQESEPAELIPPTPEMPHRKVTGEETEVTAQQPEAIPGHKVSYREFMNFIEAAEAADEDSVLVDVRRPAKAIKKAFNNIRGLFHGSYLGNAAIKDTQVDAMASHISRKELSGSAFRPTAEGRNIADFPAIEQALRMPFRRFKKDISREHPVLKASSVELPSLPAVAITSIKVGQSGEQGEFVALPEAQQHKTLASLIERHYTIERRVIAALKQEPQLLPPEVIKLIKNNQKIRSSVSVSEVHVGELEDGTLGVELCLTETTNLDTIIGALMGEEKLITLLAKKVEIF